MQLMVVIRQQLRGNTVRRISRLSQIGIAALFIFIAGVFFVEILRAGQTPGSAKSIAPVAHVVVVESMDKTCKPCEDFYHYASGEWLAKNPVPAAYPSWNAFYELAERNRQHLHEILEAAAQDT